MKSIPAIIVTALLTATVTWFVASRPAPTTAASAMKPEREVSYYQCPMGGHPRYPTHQRCTVCGMDTTAFYKTSAGGAGMGDTESPDAVPLDENMIQVLNVQTAEAKKQKLVR